MLAQPQLRPATARGSLILAGTSGAQPPETVGGRRELGRAGTVACPVQVPLAEAGRGLAGAVREIPCIVSDYPNCSATAARVVAGAWRGARVNLVFRAILTSRSAVCKWRKRVHGIVTSTRSTRCDLSVVDYRIAYSRPIIGNSARSTIPVVVGISLSAVGP